MIVEVALVEVEVGRWQFVSERAPLAELLRILNPEGAPWLDVQVMSEGAGAGRGVMRLGVGAVAEVEALARVTS